VLDDGRLSGSIVLIAPKAGNRASYEWAYSVDAGVTWILLPGTNSATTTVTGLKPGTAVSRGPVVEAPGIEPEGGAARGLGIRSDQAFSRFLA
jgi:hypothetical protein